MVLVELDIWRLASIINAITGLFILFIATNIIARCEGKLKSTMIFLTIALVMVLVRVVLQMFDLILLTQIELVNTIMNFIITLFIFLSIYNMKKVVDIVDKKKIRRR